MHYLSILSLASLALGAQYDFTPEAAASPVGSKQPFLYQPGATQLAGGLTTSFWTCSFVTASDDHQYMVLGHTMYVAGIGLARASVFDVTDPTFYEMYLYTVAGTNNTEINGVYDATVGDLAITGVSADNLGTMAVTSEHPVFSFNMTYDATSAVLFNGGLGKFNFGAEECTEWALPAGKTYGTLTVRGQELTIKPEESFTWYDRQFGEGSLTNGNYTWFQVHMPASGIRASIWAIDDHPGNGTKPSRIATFRHADGSHTVSSFEFSAINDAPYVSAGTNATYPTTYFLNFPDQGNITVRSVRANQETFNVSSGAPSAYEGFSDIELNMFGVSEKGFGLLEIVGAGKVS